MGVDLEYVRRVIVKFKDEEQIPYNSDAEVQHFFATGQIGPWLALKAQFGNLINIERLFTSVAPQRIQELTHTARDLYPNNKYANLLTYFAITCPDGVDRKSVV